MQARVFRAILSDTSCSTGSSTFSATVRQFNSRGCWKTNPIFARPALAVMAGRDWPEPVGFTVRAAFEKRKKAGRREYLRARLEQGRAVPYANQSSGVLRSAAWAEGLAEVLEGTTLEEGDSLRFIPLIEILG